MIRPLLAFTLVVCASVITAAAQTLDVKPVFRTGDEFHLRITHSREDSARPERNARTTTRVHVRVVATSPNETIINWTPAESFIDNNPMMNDPALRQAAKAAGDLSLRFALDSDGSVDRLVNQDDVVQAIQGVLDVMMRTAEAKMTPEERTRFQVLVKGVLSPQVLIAQVSADADRYFALSGAELEEGETFETEVDLPSPLGGDSIIGATIRLRGDAGPAGAITAVVSTHYDRVDFLTLVKGLMAQGGQTVPTAELDQLDAFTFQDESRYTLDRASGLPREITVTRELRLGPQQRTERWEFQRVAAPPTP